MHAAHASGLDALHSRFEQMDMSRGHNGGLCVTPTGLVVSHGHVGALERMADIHREAQRDQQVHEEWGAAPARDRQREAAFRQQMQQRVRRNAAKATSAPQW